MQKTLVTWAEWLNRNGIIKGWQHTVLFYAETNLNKTHRMQDCRGFKTCLDRLHDITLLSLWCEDVTKSVQKKKSLRQSYRNSLHYLYTCHWCFNGVVFHWYISNWTMRYIQFAVLTSLLSHVSQWSGPHDTGLAVMLACHRLVENLQWFIYFRI